VDGTVLWQSGELNRPECDIDADLGEPGSGALATLERRRSPDDPWELCGPPAGLPVQSPGGVDLGWEDRAPVHRLTIYDRTTARLLFDEPVLGSRFVFACPPAAGTHDLVMRARGWVDGGWEEAADWKPLPLSLLLGAPRERPSALQVDEPPRLMLVFTVDTECSLLRQRHPDRGTVVDQLIFGEFGDGAAHGIGLHMDLLEHLGHRGCFFVDVLMRHRFGRQALERTVAAIAERGHEIQLHLHPEHLLAAEDPAAREIGRAWAAREKDGFARVIDHAIESFVEATGEAPVAYRAGGYRIRDEHFPVLHRAGIRIDSSVNPHVNFGVSDWMRLQTQPFWVDGVLEAPPTWIAVRDNPDRPEPRAFAPNPTTGDPVTAMSPEPGDPPILATYVSHSFELLLTSYVEDRTIRADFERRLRTALPPEEAETLLRHASSGPLRLHDGALDQSAVAVCAGVLRRIADRPDARCVTYAELSTAADRLWPAGRKKGPDPVPAVDRRQGIASTIPCEPRLFSA
jgi:hypothetical protein